MVELLERDRQTLTSSVLRIVKACNVLATAALDATWSFMLLDAKSPVWAGTKLWDGNEADSSIRFGLQRAMLASAEQGRGLSELTRSPHGYTIALATLARGALEALARVNWVLASGTADELLVRHASLEFADLRYPAQHKLFMHNVGGTTRIPVVAYRAEITDTLARFGLEVKKAGMTDLATGLLEEIYNEAPQLYSGLSASAHGLGWATGNFFDADTRALKRDDQMVIEYCEYVIDSVIHVSDRFVRAFAADEASVDRWAGVRDQVWIELDSIVKRRDQPSKPEA
jgi:hypothetical protein